MNKKRYTNISNMPGAEILCLRMLLLPLLPPPPLLLFLLLLFKHRMPIFLSYKTEFLYVNSLFRMVFGSRFSSKKNPQP